MDYNEFREEILRELQKRHGDGLEITVSRIKKNNGAGYYGVKFQPQNTGEGVTLGAVFRLDHLYEAYAGGEMDTAACAESLWEEYEKNREPEDLQQFAEDLQRWDTARKNIYPVLLSAEKNADMLPELVTIPVLDLAVVFIVRGRVSGSGCSTVKVTAAMLEDYKVSGKELYDAAMANLEDDGYSFQSMDDIIRDILKKENAGNTGLDLPGEIKMYVLSNASKTYGAAGILSRKLVREFANGRDMYILPSSVHETIFVPVSDKYSAMELSRMVEDINRTQVALEERLADHCYFYDAKADEIRIEP